jgi:uncharacterized protein (DUF1778 family)
MVTIIKESEKMRVRVDLDLTFEELESLNLACRLSKQSRNGFVAKSVLDRIKKIVAE